LRNFFWRKADQLGVLGDSRGVATGERHCTREIVAKASILTQLGNAEIRAATKFRKLTRKDSSETLKLL
jgi:hypothetical protein